MKRETTLWMDPECGSDYCCLVWTSLCEPHWSSALNPTQMTCPPRLPACLCVCTPLFERASQPQCLHPFTPCSAPEPVKNAPPPTSSDREPCIFWRWTLLRPVKTLLPLNQTPQLWVYPKVCLCVCLINVCRSETCLHEGLLSVTSLIYNNPRHQQKTRSCFIAKERMRLCQCELFYVFIKLLFYFRGAFCWCAKPTRTRGCCSAC